MAVDYGASVYEEMKDERIEKLERALHRLAILAAWDIHPPVQTYVPEASDKYDLERLIRDLLNDEKLRQDVEYNTGRTMGDWFWEAMP